MLPLNFGHWTFGEVGRLGVVENWRLTQGYSWLHIANLIAAFAVVPLVVRPGRLPRLDHLVSFLVAHPGFPAFNSSLLYLLLNHAFPVALSQVSVGAGRFTSRGDESRFEVGRD